MCVRNDNSSISHSHRIDSWICCADSCEHVCVPLPFWYKLRKLEKFRFTHPPLPRYFTNFPLLPVCESTDWEQSVLPEMTNHTPVRSDELRIDFERRSIDTETYATAVGAGGKRICVRQGFMALRVRSSLSYGRTRRQKFACFGQFSRTSMASATKT